MGVPVFQVKNTIEQHNIQVFSSNFTLYGDLSKRVMSTIQQDVKAIEVYSIDESFMDLWFSDLVKSDELVQALKSYFDSKIQSIQKSKNYNQRATDLASNMRVFNRMSEIKVSPQLSRTALRYWQLEYAFTLMEQRKEKPQPPSMNNRPNNRRPPKFVPFVTIAENSPSVKTLSGLSYAEQELFAFQYVLSMATALIFRKQFHLYSTL